MSLKLSPKYGVNPSITHCFVCGKEVGLALLGRLKGDKEAPKDITDSSILCPECEALVKAGNHFIIEAKDGQTGNNPERTGRYVCVKKGSIPAITHPINFMEASLFSKLFNQFLNKDEQQKG